MGNECCTNPNPNRGSYRDSYISTGKKRVPGYYQSKIKDNVLQQYSKSELRNDDGITSKTETTNILSNQLDETIDTSHKEFQKKNLKIINDISEISEQMIEQSVFQKLSETTNSDIVTIQVDKNDLKNLQKALLVLQKASNIVDFLKLPQESITAKKPALKALIDDPIAKDCPKLIEEIKSSFKIKNVIQSQKEIYEYDEKEYLGEGCSAVVIKGTRLSDNVPVGIKKRPQKQFNKRNATGLRNIKMYQEENEYITQIDCENVMKVYDCCEDEQFRYQITEFIDGENVKLYLDQSEDKKFSEDLVCQYIPQVLKGFQALQEKNIMHRDVKLENMMLQKNKDGTQIVKIIDFDLMKHLDSLESLASELVGNEQTMAPEVQNGEYGISADVYSLGCCLYYMLYGEYPFTSEEEKLNNEVKFDENVKVSDEMKETMKQMLIADPSTRISFQNLYSKYMKDSISENPSLSEEKTLF